MSCSGNEFANLKNSWSTNNDLKPSNFDPYPELQKTENYCCDGTYNNLKSIHKQKQQILSNSVRVENYKDVKFIPTNYDLLEQTWNPQKPYSLENYPKTLPWNNPTNYDLLEQTWNPQKAYKL